MPQDDKITRHTKGPNYTLLPRGSNGNGRHSTSKTMLMCHVCNKKIMWVAFDKRNDFLYYYQLVFSIIVTLMGIILVLYS